ncbi:MAG: penicillin-binding protein 2 [Verrucomicrobiota bacterium]|jgi:cell division protein FtsI/penicillin-binding protein 2
MNLAWQYRKLYLLAFGLLLAFLSLAYRLVDWQVLRHEELQGLAATNTVRTIVRDAMRGQILDIRGNPLAVSIPAKMVCADPSLLGDKRVLVARALAPLLETNQEYLLERLAPRLMVAEGKTNLSKYVVLKHKVSLESWDQIRQTMAALPLGVAESKLKSQDRAACRALHEKAIFATDDQMRVYPNQSLAAHVLGYVSGEGAEQSGVDGIELEFNTNLTGIGGWRRTELAKDQHELVAFRDEDVAPRDGLNVVLTLDAGLQNILETELAEGMRKLSPISISSVMIRPRTGEILALANVPNFDPNHPGSFPPEALRNRVISDTHEPGSTFKIVVVSGALDRRAVSLADAFDCERGHFAYAGAVLHDHESYGTLTVENIITKSSNIGAAKIGIRLGEDSLYRYIRNFGFGSRTGIPLPFEVWGDLPPLKSWSKVSIARIPMGQGVAVTPLQMAMAMSAIANKGLLMRPMLVDRLVDASGRTAVRYRPQPVRQVASPAAMAQMVTALKTVVGSEGTAPKARLEHYTVAGKTGTAEKVENGHYASDKYFSSFIGFFPADDPQLCIAVFIDEPPKGDHFGGAAAGPIFKAIAERAANYLDLAPDIEPAAPGSPALAAAAAFPAGARPVKNN